MQYESSMRRLNSVDLQALINHFPNSRQGSLVTLTSQFGMSKSELAEWLDSPAHQLFADIVAGWIIEIIEVDRFRESIRFHLHGAGDSYSVGNFLNLCQQQTATTKAYCYVFPNEVKERQCLQSLGFGIEAVFRQHINVQGRYKDLLVYGRADKFR
jgi:RimJ/RimL family protein N-acetyltransferase